MLILITVTLLVLTALALLLIRVIQPEFRFAWMTAAIGSLLAWLSVFFWQIRLPQTLSLPAWQPRSLFVDTPTFLGNDVAWAYVLALATVSVANIFSAVARPGFPQLTAWLGTCGLTALGILAVLADNPLTLVLVWAAIDLAELFLQLRSVDGARLGQRVALAFSIRTMGLGLLVWASLVSLAAGVRMDFEATPAQAGIFLLAAAGLRLGVLPLHLPFSTEGGMRRGFGTALRLVAAVSSLALLARIPAASMLSPWTPLLMALTALAALYGGWMWLRSNSVLNGRPFWLIGMAALSMLSTLRGNPVGSASWGMALVLAGAPLFLVSMEQTWLRRTLLAGALSITALPFTLTAAGWQSGTPLFWGFWPFFTAAQALLIGGYIRHALRPVKKPLSHQPIWTQNAYLFGLSLPLIVLILLGIWGWRGALQFRAWPAGVAACLLTAGGIWLGRRLKLPQRAHWVRPESVSWLDWLYRILDGIYRAAGSLSRAFSALLEGDGGILWTLVFIVLFISLFSQGAGTP